MIRSTFVRILPLAVLLGSAACSSNDNDSQGESGGQSTQGTASGGSSASSVSSGGVAGSSQTSKGGSSSASSSSAEAGSSATAGRSATGGSSAKGGSATGGKGGTGGIGGVSSAGGGGAGTTSTGGTGSGTGGRTDADAGAGGEGGKGGKGGSAGSGGAGGTGGVGGNSNPDASAPGGNGGYNPCKASPCVILPLGDSITNGFGSSDGAGYRSALFKLIVAANQNVTFIGSQSGGPNEVSGKPFPKNHEGHNGATVAQITGFVPPKQAFSTTPHIVLLHAGTNDMTSNANATTTANQLDTCISNIVAAAPDALVVVAKIVPLGYNNSNYTSYIAKIPDLVTARASKNVVMVDMSTLPASDIKGNGDVHPTAKGYSDMADLWYGAIKDYLPKN